MLFYNSLNILILILRIKINTINLFNHFSFYSFPSLSLFSLFVRKIHNRAQPQTRSTTKSHMPKPERTKIHKNSKNQKKYFAKTHHQIQQIPIRLKRERSFTKNLRPLPQTLTTIFRREKEGNQVLGVCRFKIAIWGYFTPLIANPLRMLLW